jgi:hypothetical protein
VFDIDKRVRPKTLLQFFPRHHLAGLLQQNDQNLKRLAAKLQPHSRLTQLTGAQINLEIPESQESELARGLCHGKYPRDL